MPIPHVFIPFDRELYADIVYLSDGKIDPSAVAENLVRQWIGATIHDGMWPGEHLWTVAQKYAPEVADTWDFDSKRVRGGDEDAMPLVWKDVTVPAGSEVRMSYGGKYHYAKVQKGRITEVDGGSYSPSEWASKVADGTSRNAWRDLWFREPLSSIWVPAQVLRQKAEEELNRHSTSVVAGGSDA